MPIELHEGDLPDGTEFGSCVAVDSETMGLNPHRDRLCVVQLSGGDGNAEIVQIKPGQSEAPNLKRLLADINILKIYHFGRFDIAVLAKTFGVWANCRYPFPNAMVRQLFATVLPSLPESSAFSPEILLWKIMGKDFGKA